MSDNPLSPDYILSEIRGELAKTPILTQTMLDRLAEANRNIDFHECEDDEYLDEASVLRAEDAQSRYDAHMEDLDRRDRMGPHWIWRD